MKLATYKDGSRDGQLVVVSRDLGLAHFATAIATRLQQVLDDWNFLSPQLQDLYVTLNQGKARHAFAFEPHLCMAPLPRAFQWVQVDDGATAAAGGAPGGPPPLVQCAGDALLGPCDDAWFGAEAWGVDLGAGLAALTGDVAMGASASQGLDSVRLLLLANTWRLRQLPGAGADPDALPSWPAAAFGPVAVTPDELGEAWRAGRVHGALQVAVNGRRIGLVDPAADAPWHIGELVARAAMTRHLGAGSLVGTGPLGSTDPSRGHGSLVRRRAAEAARPGAPTTPWLATGDRVRLELLDQDGQSLLGAIDQRVSGPQTEAAAEPEQSDVPPPPSPPHPTAARQTAISPARLSGGGQPRPAPPCRPAAAPPGPARARR